jgi:hypothetical protein
MSARRRSRFLEGPFLPNQVRHASANIPCALLAPGAADARALVRIDDDAGDRPSPTLVQTDASVWIVSALREIVSALREPITVSPLRKTRL